jgi:hypothetical protein
MNTAPKERMRLLWTKSPRIVMIVAISVIVNDVYIVGPEGL